MVRLFAFVFVVLFLFRAEAAKKVYKRKVASIEYTCTLKWQTLYESMPEKKVTWRESQRVKIKDDLEVLLESNSSHIILTVKQPFNTNPDDSLSFSFGCDQYLNCSGTRTTSIAGQSAISDLNISPNGYTGKASLEGRDYFTFNSFEGGKVEYNFIAYYDEKKQPLGLKVVCHE